MILTTTKGRYRRGEAVAFRLALTTEEWSRDGLELSLQITHLDREIYREIVPLGTDPGDLLELSFSLPEEDIPDQARGFGCEGSLLHEGGLVGSDSTAFDFLEPSPPVIRYGFLCDFGPGDGDSQASLDFLSEFHITHVQFYDWTYRHHQYRGPAAVFEDTMGKTIDSDAVRRKIEGCQSRGMKALGYGAVYAAGIEYLEEHPDQALRDADGSIHNLIDKFFIMDIRPGTGWRSCLMEQYRYAREEAGFDGIHMDTYGFPKRAYLFRKDGTPGDQITCLEEEFPGLIHETRTVLGDEAVLIFNNVGNWPVHTTGPAPQDAVYIEVWEPYDRYDHIRQIILGAARYEKPVILAAYLAPFRTEENHGGSRALNAALILHSIITSLGASHLLVGENGAVLTQGYYNDYSPLRPDERPILRRYYDFQVRYQDRFYDSTLTEISETHTAGENREYFFSGAPVSADGRPGTVWTLVREGRRRRVINLINLISQEEAFWNRVKKEPARIDEFILEMPVEGEICRAFAASPDRNNGGAEAVTVEKTRNSRGAALRVVLRDLSLWTLLVVEWE